MKKRKIHFPAWLLVVCISFGIFGDSVTAIAETSPDTEAYTDIFTSEWYRNGYEQGLYRNRGLDHTVGYKFQNETIGNILMMAEDPILLANGWNLATFFDGTVFKEIDIETLKELQAEGINDLGYLLEMSSYALASSYTLGATASDEYKNFSMDLYDDEHGTLYLLTLGSHTVYCINYGKHSPKGTTYSKKTLDDYLTTSQQEVLTQCYLFWIYERNVEYGDGSLVWGKHTAFPKIASDSMYYLYMQICTWAALKNCDFLGCIDAVRDAIIDWDTANSTWANNYYKAGESFYRSKLYDKYTVTMGVYSSGNSANQDMLVFDHATLTFPPVPESLSSKNKVTLTKTSNTDGAVTTAGFGLYEWNGTSYTKVEDLTHSGSGVYTSGIVVDCTTTNKGKWRIAETTYPANHVQGNNYVDFNIAEELVTVFYQTFLERDPDTGGLASWSSQLTSGTSEKEVMKGIAISTEAAGKLTNKEYTKALYDLLLFKTPTDANYTYWNNCLTDGTYTRSTMFDFFWSHADHANGVLAGAIARITLSYSMTNIKQGRIKITKTSGNTSITGGNSNYALTGAKYGVYSDSTCKTLVATLTTNSSGTVTSGYLDPGTYYVKEITASKGYNLDTTVHKTTVKTNATVSVSSKEPPITGSIKVVKTSSVDAGISLQGAIYGVYSNSACTTQVTTIKTNASGIGTATGLALGTYYVKEKTAPAGYELDTTVYTAKCNSATAVQVNSVDTPSSGYGYLIKTSSDTSVSGNSNYSLAGAVYGVYSDAACTVQVTTMTTDANGKSNTVTLTPGTYYVKEMSAPPGFELDTSIEMITITAGKTSSINAVDDPIPGFAYIEKQNSDPVFTNVIPSYTLINATFGIYATQEEAAAATVQNPGSPLHTFTTTIEVKDTNNPDYVAFKAESEKIELLAGTYYVKELQAPKGFVGSAAVHTVSVTVGETAKVEIINIPRDVEEFVEEVGIYIKKADRNGNALTGAAFMVEKYDKNDNAWIHPYLNRDDSTIVTMSNQLTTDANGEILFEKLEPGKYRITETAAPAGYSLLAEPVIVDLPVKVSASLSPGGADYTQDGYDYWLTYEMIVHDGQFINMPFTGGIGVLLPVVGGALLTLIGGLLIRRK